MSRKASVAPKCRVDGPAWSARGAMGQARRSAAFRLTRAILEPRARRRAGAPPPPRRSLLVGARRGTARRRAMSLAPSWPAGRLGPSSRRTARQGAGRSGAVALGCRQGWRTWPRPRPRPGRPAGRRRQGDAGGETQTDRQTLRATTDVEQAADAGRPGRQLGPGGAARRRAAEDSRRRSRRRRDAAKGAKTRQKTQRRAQADAKCLQAAKISAPRGHLSTCRRPPRAPAAGGSCSARRGPPPAPARAW